MKTRIRIPNEPAVGKKERTNPQAASGKGVVVAQALAQFAAQYSWQKDAACSLAACWAIVPTLMLGLGRAVG